MTPRVLFAAFVLIAAPATPAFAGLADDVEDYLDPVVVTATRSSERTSRVPALIDSFDTRQLRRNSPRTLPQALQSLPGVLVQETAPGQGSPFLRGFTGFLNVLLIDGIRLNNSVFRSGPNQYWNTIDPWSLERLEVVKGPGSVLYGSDAVGGTVQAFIRNPYAYGKSWNAAGQALYRVSSAENSHVARLEASAGHGDAWALVLGTTFKHYGDLIAGDPLNRQPDTGYDDWAGDFKLERLLDDDTRLVFAYQHVQQNNVPRQHKTVNAKSFHGTSTGSELQRDLDQERWLAYVQFHQEAIGGVIDVIRASLSWHSQSELRDRIRPPSGGGTENRRDLQGFDVGTLGAWVQLESDTALGRLVYGLEYYRDFVSSFSSRNPIQGPVADDATYDLLGIYAQVTRAAGERWTLIYGIRLNYAAADADSVQDPDTGTQTALSDNWTAVVASLRAVFELVPERWNLFGGVSQGFRAPNLSDLTRLDSARSGEFEIPSPGLDPEHYIAFEVGAKGHGSNFRAEVSLFYTVIRDQIIRSPNGVINGDGEAEVIKSNVGDGWIYGLEAAASLRVGRRITLFGNFTFQQGKVDAFPTSAAVEARDYIDRLMPVTAQLGVRWESADARFFVELVGVMADKADKLSARDAADTQRIPPGGTPGYGVVHLRGGWRIDGHTQLNAAIENLFDKSYRVHGSGHNMPGLNFVFSITRDF